MKHCNGATPSLPARGRRYGVLPMRELFPFVGIAANQSDCRIWLMSCIYTVEGESFEGENFRELRGF